MAPGASEQAAAPPDAVLAARGVYRFVDVDSARVPILKDVTFELQRASFTTIMGPSGSGKSTLMHILAGLDRPSAGEVWLDGESISDAGEERRTLLRRRRIGFIFQFFNLLPDLTVEENVTLPLRIAGRRPAAHGEKVDRLLDLLGIDALRARRPAGLSGGEMQRVSIARALVAEPPLLMADEPTGNLSSKAGEEVLALLQQVQRELQTTVLLVTHNPRDAAVGDTVLFLRDGQLDTAHALTGGDFVAADVFRRLEELGI